VLSTLFWKPASSRMMPSLLVRAQAEVPRSPTKYRLSNTRAGSTGELFAGDGAAEAPAGFGQKASRMLSCTARSSEGAAAMPSTGTERHAIAAVRIISFNMTPSVRRGGSLNSIEQPPDLRFHLLQIGFTLVTRHHLALCID